ncbi:MAG: hypothetical protein QOE55_2600 [Acidobacteriaceae bacterium]|nr:hypothetical protein [Acidobacteriaceae bacterium]
MIQSFAENGLGDHATAFANGETAAMTKEQVQRGFCGTGLIETAAEHGGVSPQAVLPLVMSHFAVHSAAAGTPGAEQSGLSGSTESLLKRFMRA